MESKNFHVRVSDVGDHADLRFGDGRQRADLAGVVHAHFEHADAASVGQAQDGERHADVVVEIADGLADGQFDCQQVRDGVLGGGFARAARDADHAVLPTAGAPMRPGSGGRARVSGTTS